MAGHHIAAALVTGERFHLDRVFAGVEDQLLDHFATEFDNVGQIDEAAILRVAVDDPAGVTDPVGEQLRLPALTLESDVVLEGDAHRIGGSLAVVHRIDRLG